MLLACCLRPSDGRDRLAGVERVIRNPWHAAPEIIGMVGTGQEGIGAHRADGAGIGSKPSEKSEQARTRKLQSGGASGLVQHHLDFALTTNSALT